MGDEDTIFVLTREDVIECAQEMGIPDKEITDDVLALDELNNILIRWYAIEISGT